MTSFKRALSVILSLSLISFSIANVQAAIVTNQQIIHHEQQLSDKDRVLQTLNRAEVREQLSQMGVSATDLETRINQMTQAELAQLQQQITDLPAGADVLGFILVIFVVFVITDVLGATDIFPFIHPVR